MDSSVPYSIYQKNQLLSVICQLRFPRILSIGAKEPAEFQESVREEFPRFSMKLEPLPPKIVTQNGTVTQVKQDAVRNYAFTSMDGKTVLNLTDSFLSVTAESYRCWEDFAAVLDRVAAAFFTIYRPAVFERIGLRYVNAVSKEELGLEAQRWSDLIDARWCGLLSEEEAADGDFLRCSQDAELSLRGGCNAKVHCGPGMVRRNGALKSEACFVLDLDLFLGGQILPQHLTGALSTVHTNADRLFRDAITEELHRAMQPE